MWFIVSHLLALTLLLSAFAMAGRLVEHAIPALVKIVRGSLIRRLAVGIAAWIYVLFAMAAVQLYRPLPIWVALGTITLGGVAVSLREWRLPALGPEVRAAWPMFLPAMAVIAAVFVLTLHPWVGWDDNTYHLALPKQYLAHGGFRAVPFSLFSNWPLGIELIYGMALVVQDHVLAKQVHWLFLVLLLVEVFLLCRRHATPLIASIAVLFVLVHPLVLFEAQVAYVDIAFAFFFLVAFELAVEHLERQQTLPLVLAGVFCGVMAGIKLTGIFGVVCLGVLCVGNYVLRRVPIRQASHWLLALGLPTALLATPWYVKTYVFTGNPFYPLLFGVFGGPDWSQANATAFAAWQRDIGIGRTFRDHALIGRHWIPLLSLALLAMFRVQLVFRCLAVTGVFFALWALSSRQPRFLIPVFGPLAIASALAVNEMLGFVRSPRVRRKVEYVVAFGLVAVFVHLTSHVLGAFKNIPRVVDARSHLASAIPSAYRFINAHTPPDSKVLMINTNHGFFLEREYVADSAFEASQVASAFADAASDADVQRRLSELGITHILLDQRDWGIQFPPAFSGYLARLPALHSSSHVVYAVAP